MRAQERVEVVVGRRVRDLPRCLQTGQGRPGLGSVASDDSDARGGVHHDDVATAIERSRVEVSQR